MTTPNPINQSKKDACENMNEKIKNDTWSISDVLDTECVVGPQVMKQYDKYGNTKYVYVVYAISDHGNGTVLKLTEREDMDGYEIPIGMFADDVVISVERQRKDEFEN